MSGGGDCPDNAMPESSFVILKAEFEEVLLLSGPAARR